MTFLNMYLLRTFDVFLHTLDWNSVTGDFMKTVYISNHPRETSTNQILNAREHNKMEVDNKSSYASWKHACNEGNSVFNHYFNTINVLRMRCKF